MSADPAHRSLVVGTGSIGERHVRCLLKTQRSDVWIAEANAEVRERVASAYGLPGAFSSLDEALSAGPRFDVAVVATPAPLHIPMARQVVAQGLHLLLEKPLSTSMEGVTELQQEVSAAGVTAAVGYVYRAHPSIQQMRDELASGRHGRPVQVVMTAGQSFATYRPAYREIYYARHDQGGGAIQDAITHMLNAVTWMVGPVERLLADSSHQLLDGVTVEDTVHLITRHGPVLGSFSLNQYQAPNEVGVTVVCTKGTLRFSANPPEFRLMAAPDTAWDIRPADLSERDDLYVRQANAFLDAVEGRAQVLCTIAEAAETLGVCLAALQGQPDSSWLRPEPSP